MNWWERSEIAHWRGIGARLTNQREGGEGGMLDEEGRKKISAVHKGRKQSTQQITRRADANRGRKNTPETIARMSKASLGRAISEETKQKMSAAHTGQPKSAEHVEKVRQANLGQKRSDETKRKMKEAAKLRWARGDYNERSSKKKAA